MTDALASLAPHLRRLIAARPQTPAARAAVSAALLEVCEARAHAFGMVAELARAGDVEGAAFVLADSLTMSDPQIAALRDAAGPRRASRHRG